jgi:HAMP domain-containing protein
MNSSNNLKSGQKALSMQMLILAVVIILIAFIGLFIQKSSINNGGFKDYQRTSKLSRDINSVHSNLYRIKGMVASSQDKQEIAKLSDQQAAIITEDINLVKKTLETNISAEQKKYYQALMDNLIEYQKSSLQVIRLAPLGTGGAYLSSANEKMEATNLILTQLLDYESNAGNSSNIAFYIVIIALVVLLVLCFILIPSFIKKMLTGAVIEPLQEAAGVLREYANGKYTRSLVWEADDAIGELVQSVNSLRSKISSPAAGPAHKTQTPETVTAPADEKSRSLSDMIKKTPEQTKDVDKLVISSRKAIDKLQDI